jgi:hypothetical protein
MALKLHTQISFSHEIEKIVREKNICYFDAVCDFCRECQIEPENVPKLLTQQIKQQIEQEATELNLINRGRKKTNILE